MRPNRVECQVTGKERTLFILVKYVTSSFLDIYTTDGDLLNSAIV